MPWQEVCVQERRIRFIHDWQKQEDSMAELCRRYGISRRVGYKWIERYKLDGIEGLQDHSRAPKRHPNQTPATIEERILALRAKHSRWGPTTLKAVLERKDAAVKWPARSTIGNLLRRRGLSVPRRRRPRAAPTRPPLTPMQEPNQVWSIDFKGWFRTQDGQALRPADDQRWGQPLSVALPSHEPSRRRTCAAADGSDVSGIWLAAGDAQRQWAAVCDPGGARVVVAGSMVDSVGDLSGANRTETPGTERPA